MAHADPSTLTHRLERWLGERLGQPAHIGEMARIAGGASRATYRFTVSSPTPSSPPRPLILRLDPVSSLIETERRREFAALQAFHGSAVPVPKPLWLEPDGAPLGSPFFIMEAVENAEGAPLKLMGAPYAPHHDRIGQQKWTILGHIAAADPQALGLDRLLATDSSSPVWQRELDRWENVLNADELEPQPIQRAAIRWLRRNPPPPPARLSVVHGDYRTGNFMVDAHGTIRAILDWEMVHLGDPLEDLAWSLNRVWCFQHDERRGGLLPRDRAIAHWAAAAGAAVDPVALHWWEVFVSLKGQAIWLSAAREFQCKEQPDSIMAMAAWMMCNSQDRVTLELLGHLERP